VCTRGSEPWVDLFLLMMDFNRVTLNHDGCLRL
jgi:hypothetical protein